MTTHTISDPRVLALVEAAGQLALMASDFPTELHKDHPDVKAVLELVEELRQTPAIVKPEKQVF